MTNHADAHRAEARSRMLEWARCSRITRAGGRMHLQHWETPLRTCLTIVERDADGNVINFKQIGELWLA